MTRSFLLLPCVLLLAACGNSGPHAADVDSHEPIPEDNVFKPLVKAEDKARAVQGVVDQQKRDTDKALEASE